MVKIKYLCNIGDIIHIGEAKFRIVGYTDYMIVAVSIRDPAEKIEVYGGSLGKFGVNTWIYEQ